MLCAFCARATGEAKRAQRSSRPISTNARSSNFSSSPRAASPCAQGGEHQAGQVKKARSERLDLPKLTFASAEEAVSCSLIAVRRGCVSSRPSASKHFATRKTAKPDRSFPSVLEPSRACSPAPLVVLLAARPCSACF